MLTSLPDSYRLRLGSEKERTLLVRFMSLTYGELFSDRDDFPHLATTVDQYFSSETPVWWVDWLDASSTKKIKSITVGCLWMGSAIDQISGDRYSHIFLIYVDPSHRRRGIAQVLLETAQNWARLRGDRQIGLQVFPHNQRAIELYQSLGYQTHSLLMLKRID